jgi:predicted nucleic acid-binding Zn ribbon protein
MVKRARMRFPLPLGDVARQEFSSLGLADRLREADIWRFWPEVVGPAIAARAMPLRIIKGVLTVAVSNGPWMQELRFLTAMMRDKLNERLGGDIVREIVLKAGRVDQAGEPAPEDAPRKKRLTSRQVALIDGLSASIVDSETREAFMALMKSSLENH